MAKLIMGCAAIPMYYATYVVFGWMGIICVLIIGGLSVYMETHSART